MPNRTCAIPECGKPHRAKGFCVAHYNDVKYAGVPKYRLVEIPCGHCGVAMLKPRRTDRANQFCSFECRDSYRRVRGTLGAPRRRVRPSVALVHVGTAPLYCVIPPQHPARSLRQKPQRLFVHGPCTWCGEVFTIIDQTQSRYCSARCSRSAGRSRRPDRFEVRPSVRIAIYDRDGWMCQLCNDPVDRTLGPSDLWGATLDHIECQSWALIPDHSPGNLRLAHRWCNSVRGDETYYTAADLLTA